MAEITALPPPPVKGSATLDNPTNGRKTNGFLGCGCPMIFAALIVVVAVAGASVYLFAFDGLAQVEA